MLYGRSDVMPHDLMSQCVPISYQYHTPAKGTLENMPPTGQTLCCQRAVGCRSRAVERSSRAESDNMTMLVRD